jgi:uncharacterized repeat protein (TIGR03803 family)
MLIRTARKWVGILLLSIIAMLVASIASSQLAAAQAEKIIYTFPSADGTLPFGKLLLKGSTLYGITEAGGSYSAGTVYKVTLSGTETLLYTFTGGADGGWPSAGLIGDSEGNLYGTTSSGGTYGFGIVFEVTSGGTEKVLYSFTGQADGNSPGSSLVRDAMGNLYGTTSAGGYSSSLCPQGCGVLFEVTPAGTERVLHSFTGELDGWSPYNDPLLLVGSNLYGVVGSGGAYGYGSVFKVTLAGKETILYSFTGGTDGNGPAGPLIRDAKGNLYGTTVSGGNSLNSSNCNNVNFGGGCGTVFELSPSGVETVLYNFQGGTDGIFPFDGVVRDTNGNIYGSTLYGANSACHYGCGTVFEVTPSGTETQLFLFSGSNGTWPEGVVRDAKGNLYGVTGYGGNPGCHEIGCGLVFEITP